MNNNQMKKQGSLNGGKFYLTNIKITRFSPSNWTSFECSLEGRWSQHESNCYEKSWRRCWVTIVSFGKTTQQLESVFYKQRLKYTKSKSVNSPEEKLYLTLGKGKNRRVEVQTQHRLIKEGFINIRLHHSSLMLLMCHHK